jgi:hypothetical protein
MHEIHRGRTYEVVGEHLGQGIWHGVEVDLEFASFIQIIH